MRYVLTGGSAAVVDAGGFVALVAAAVNLSPDLALRLRAGLSRVRFAKFLVFAIVGSGINVGTTLVLIHAAVLPPTMAKIGGIGFALFVNFAINAGLVFRERPT